ncbi:2-oxoacid:acceptor oxidoreductase family protein [Peptoniphilus sp.]|uniref:2-oxoacid:acceptor oxidoreductase family protein n=1 Tax=Peptoniphilus sp. TaxID=1971214 RepID=UPI003992728D
MTRKIVMAGFGGQGVMAMGQLISYAGMLEGKHVSWYPSYGPEMRGGAANCSVVVSEELVGSPIIAVADDVIVMNEPSLSMFESHVRPGGNLFINSSLVKKETTRTDINVVKIPVNDIAIDLGNARVANMVMLGAYLKVTELVKVESVIQAFTKVYGDKKKKLLPINEKAIEFGGEAVGKEYMASVAENKVESKTPEHYKHLKGGEEEMKINYLNDIRQMDKEQEDKIFSSELNIVKQAILNEIESINYFKMSSEQLGGEAKEVFLSLAHQSEEHVDYLNKLKSNIEKDESTVIEKIKSSLEGKTLEWGKVDPENATMVLSVFNLGMNIKKVNIKFYEKAAARSEVPEAKGLYKELAYWENFQLTQIAKQYEELKSEWWSDQSYAPF